MISPIATSGSSSRRAEYAAMTRSALIEAAIAEFVERGYEAATMNAVARRARVTKGAAYHHFSSKAGLWEAVVVTRVGAVLIQPPEPGSSCAEWESWLGDLVDRWHTDAAQLAAVLTASPGHTMTLGAAVTAALQEYHPGEVSSPVLRRLTATAIAAAVTSRDPGGIEVAAQMINAGSISGLKTNSLVNAATNAHTKDDDMNTHQPDRKTHPDPEIDFARSSTI